jgi:raffinose/stachyose/melibiose transport system substrate-binding protein
MKGIIRLLTVLLMVAIALPAFANGGSDEAVAETGEIVLSFPTFWVGQDSKSGPLASLLEAFNNQHEGEIKVLIEPNPDTDGYRDKINTQLSSGRAPDIFVFNPDPTTFQYYDSDILMDFTEELSGSWRDNFVESYVIDSTRDGATKSVPFEIAITPIWYNSELFSKVGVSEFPATMDEFLMVAEKLKAEGIVPTSQMTGGTNAWTSMLWYSHILGSLGGPDAMKQPLTDPIYAEAAAVLKQLYSDGNTTRDAVGGDAGVSGGHYMAADTAVFINGPWYIGRIRGDAPEVHSATKLSSAPQVGEYGGNQIGFMLSNLAAANTDDPRKREAVVTFMKFMTDPDNVKAISESAGSLFAVKYELGADADPLQREFVRVSSEATFVTGGLHNYYPVSVIQEFGQALAALVLDEATPDEFVQMLIDAQ